MQTLDQHVTVIDPRAAEAEFTREYKDASTREDFERVAAQSLERRLRSGEDVPLIEDFPLAPEEETPDFKHLRSLNRFGQSCRTECKW
jgi:hypothetical protein